MKKSLTLLTLSLTSLLPFSNANAYQDLNVTLDGVTYNLISHTNNWWLPGGEPELGDLTTPGYDLSQLLDFSQVRGGTRAENTPVPPLGSTGTYFQINGNNSTTAFQAIVYAADGSRYSLTYNRTNFETGIMDGLSLASVKKRVNGVWQDLSTTPNGTNMVFPSTLNFSDHIANENVKNFFEWGLSTTLGPANLFTNTPSYYTPPAPPSPEDGGASGGVVSEQAQQLNIGLSFQNGQWVPEE